MASPLYFLLLASLLVHAHGIRVQLNHIDSGKNLTQLERVKRAVERSKQRAEGFRAMKAGPVDAGVKVSPGNGEYLMTVSIGTPPLQYPAVADTGSDLIWTQCDPCLFCFHQPTPVFNPKKSSSFKKLPCSSGLCQALPIPLCLGSCWYTYSYGDSSSTTGYMGTETFTLGEAGKSASVPNVGFGCGIVSGGSFGGDSAGLVGLGRGELSLISQLDEPKFSYCLTKRDTSETSYLLLGSGSDTLPSGEKVTTALIKNLLYPSFYYMKPDGVVVNGAPVDLPSDSFGIDLLGNGGMIVDSGTTLTLLEKTIYSPVVDALAAQIPLDSFIFPVEGFDYCYVLPDSGSGVELPTLGLVFGDSVLELKSENYFFQVPGGVCLAFAASDQFSILGNVAQQDYFVNFDVLNGALTFVKTNCGSGSS